MIARRLARLFGAVANFAALVALACAAAAVCISEAKAQTACTDQWELSGQSFSVTLAGVTGATYCAAEAARLAGYGSYTVGNCAASDTGASYDLLQNGVFQESRTWVRLPAGCGTAAPPDGPASSVEFTGTEPGNLLLWGVLVMIFGIGYIGGRQR
ncbi:MAG: hypothetical protein JST92_13870 [Deltaproteobacteria bacterium]|nr:hypothetical protein [Deltaproteobacteria bacterium]